MVVDVGICNEPSHVSRSRGECHPLTRSEFLSRFAIRTSVVNIVLNSLGRARINSVYKIV